MADSTPLTVPISAPPSEAPMSTAVTYTIHRNQTVRKIEGDDPNAVPAIRNFSTGLAAKQVFGAEQKQYKKQLIALKTRNEGQTGAVHALHQEDLQDWLDNLQFRLSEACNVPSDSAGPALGSGSPSAATKEAPRRPGANQRASSHFQFPEVLPMSDDNVKDGTAPKTGKARSARSGSAIGDSILAALTDSTYLEELQEKIEKESIASLHERLAERKVKEQEPKPSMGARAKLLLPKVQKKSKKSTEQAEKPARFYDDAESVVSISASNSADSLISYLKNVSKSVIANKNSPVKMEKFYERSEVMRLLQFIFLAEKVEEIYTAAETLILPPARRPSEVGTIEVPRSGRDSPGLIFDNNVVVEDFWETQKTIGKTNM